jgi:hypothetical protein
MNGKIKIVLVAMLGTLFGFLIVKSIIIPVTFWQYFAIEVVVTIFHMLYETVKQKEVNI